MRTIISFIIVIAIIADSSCSKKINAGKSPGYETTDKYGNKMLLGRCTKKSLQQEPYARWFIKNYSDYKIDTQACEQLKRKLAGKNFEIFMGTWCGDSKREVPRMFKILDYCGIKSSQIKLIMVNNKDSMYKQSPQHEERGMNIHRVPDFIVFDNKKEKGRIIESPVISLEKDLLAISNDEHYEPNYKAVAALIDFLEKPAVPSSENEIESLANMIKPFSKSMGELNTFGYVKMASGEMDKAQIAFRINTILYPENANVFDSMGDFYARNNKSIDAKENYQKALQLAPSNDETRKKLAQLRNN